MPLSTVLSGRKPIHTRSIECKSFFRPDGLWDIEGHLTDIKGYPFFNKFRGEVEPIGIYTETACDITQS